MPSARLHRAITSLILHFDLSARSGDKELSAGPSRATGIARDETRCVEPIPQEDGAFRTMPSVFVWLLDAGEELEAGTGGGVFADVVHLEGGVFDIVLVGEEPLEVAAAGVTVLVLADEHVGR